MATARTQRVRAPKKAPLTLDETRKSFATMVGEKLAAIFGRVDATDLTVSDHERRLVELEQNPTERDTLLSVMEQIKDLK